MKIAFILLSFVLISCDNNTVPVEPVVTVHPGDVTVQQKLIGRWELGSAYSITFRDNGTYVDSSWMDTVVFDPGANRPNICSTMKKGNLFLDRVTTGKYTIQDGMLKKQPVSYTVQCNPLKAPANYGYETMMIDVNDDSLKLREVKVWVKVSGQSQDIWNSWERYWWSWSFHKDLPLNGAAISVKESITFMADSTFYVQKMDGLPYENSEYRRPFEYASSKLKGKDDFTEYIVSYSNGTMYWVNNTFTYHYKRVK